MLGLSMKMSIHFLFISRVYYSHQNYWTRNFTSCLLVGLVEFARRQGGMLHVGAFVIPKKNVLCYGFKFGLKQRWADRFSYCSKTRTTCKKSRTHCPVRTSNHGQNLVPEQIIVLMPVDCLHNNLLFIWHHW